jgi:hypothetical protein
VRDQEARRPSSGDVGYFVGGLVATLTADLRASFAKRELGAAMDGRSRLSRHRNSWRPDDFFQPVQTALEDGIRFRASRRGSAPNVAFRLSQRAA